MEHNTDACCCRVDPVRGLLVEMQDMPEEHVRTALRLHAPSFCIPEERM